MLSTNVKLNSIDEMGRDKPVKKVNGTIIVICLLLFLPVVPAKQNNADKNYYLNEPTYQTQSQNNQEPNDYLNENDTYINNASTNYHEEKGIITSYNHLMFHINDFMDTYLLKPAARFYNKAMPRPLNTAADHIFINLETISHVINDGLQANFYQTISDTWRLSINSIIGVLGAFDVASKIDLPNKPQDFGLTMARWGWVNSRFFVVPFFGPKTIRDAIALVPNYLTSVYPYMESVSARNSLWFWSKMDIRAQLLQFEDVYQQAAIDPYVFQRNAYLQRRYHLIKHIREPEKLDPAKKIQMAMNNEDNYINE